MTADQGNRDIIDALLSSEACAIYAPSVVDTSLDEVPSHSQNAFNLGLLVSPAEEETKEISNVPNISVTTLGPCQDEIDGIQILNMSDVTSSTADLALIQDSVQTVERLPSCSDSMERLTETGNVMDRDYDQADVVQVHTRTNDASIQSILRHSDKCSNQEDQSIAVSYTDIWDVLNETVSQDDSGFNIISECQFSPETLTGLPPTKVHQEQLVMAQSNLDENVLLLSNHQQTKDQGENASQIFSKTPISLQTQTQPLAVDSGKQTFLDVMTRFDNVGPEELLCSPVAQGNDIIEKTVHLSDPVDTTHNTATEIRGKEEKFFCNVGSEISDDTNECIHKTDSEIADLMEFTPYDTATAISGTVEASATCTEYETDHIAEDNASNTESIIKTIGDEISTKSDQEETYTVEEGTNNSFYNVLHLEETGHVHHLGSEIGDIKDETSFKNSKDKVIEPVTENNDSKYVAGASVEYNIDPDHCYIEETACNIYIKDSLGESVRGCDPKRDTITGVDFMNSNFEICKFVRYDLTVDSWSTSKVNPALEIPVINETWHKDKDNTVNNTPVLRQPSPPLSSSRPCSKCMCEGEDNTQVFTPADRLTDLTANLLENVLTQIPKDPFSGSDPWVESQSVVDNRPENNPDTHFLTSSLFNTSVECSQISKKCETPAVVRDLDMNSRGVKGDCSEVTDVINNSKPDESNELWLDACQFLTHEVERSSILDEWGHSSTPSPPETTPDNKVYSGSSQEREATIGHWPEEWELPLVERWSSSDSWASALSDWFQAGIVLGEDSPTSAKPPDCISPADTQTELFMTVQDVLDEQKACVEHPSTTQEACLGNVCPHPTKTGLGGVRVRPPQGDNIDESGLKEAEEDLQVDTYTDRNLQDLSNDTAPTLREKGIPVEMVIPSGAFKPEQESGLQEGTMASVLRGKDYPAGGYVNQCIIGTKLGTSVLRVTEHSVTQLLPDFKEEGERNYGPLRFSGYPSEKDPTSGCVTSKEQSLELNPNLVTHTSQGNQHVLSKLEHLTHTQDVKTSHTPSLFGQNESIIDPHSEDLYPTQVDRKSKEPVFIMPFAPINTPISIKDKQTSLKPLLVDHLAGNSTSAEETSGDQFYTCPQESHKQISSSICGDLDVFSPENRKIKTETSDIEADAFQLFLATGERFMISEKKRIANVTLDLCDSILNFNFNKHRGASCEKDVEFFPEDCDVQLYCEAGHKKETKMPPKTPKTSSESQTRFKHKGKTPGPQAGPPSRKPEKVNPEVVKADNKAKVSDDGAVTIIETIIITEKSTPKTSGKKKKHTKQGQQGATKPESKTLTEEDNTTMPTSTRASSESAEVKLTPETGKIREKPTLLLTSTMANMSSGNLLKADDIKADKKVDTNVKSSSTKERKATCSQEAQSMCPPGSLDDDSIKRRRISKASTEAAPIRTRPQLPAVFRQRKEDEAGVRRAYSDVVKQKTQTAKEAVLPHVVTEIQASPVPDDAQSISLWCQISPVPADSTITWTKEGSVLSQEKRGLGDNGRFSLLILKACSKNLGMYHCSLGSPQCSTAVSTSDYHLTSEVLMELVIPSHDTPAESTDVEREEENVHCAPLLFKEDILTDRYFGENQPASIVTEKAHFGEGMHRKAFRTILLAGMVPLFRSGHPCVLKVHNAISYGTKDNEELIQKNYSLAVEECHVQNTAREYIKAYTDVAKSAESFGEVPEIIPIYLVHRPSNDIPYATLEEELIGDFVKYSVKDGKEINLMRRDSEAGQKCCAFQHWVYAQTDGNLLVTDMQGVGMKLTDVGIATCRKGYKGFKGNCATSFIDQFKALHQCNSFCELLGLTSLQPKPKRTAAPPKPKTQPGSKKKTSNPVLKGKS